MENELKKFLTGKYNFEINSIQKNLQSTVGNVYIVYGNNKYVVKVYDSINHTNAMINLHEIVKKSNLYVPNIVYNNSGKGYTEFYNKYVVVYTFLEGHQIAWDINKIKLTDYEMDKLAKTVRKLHKLTNNEIIGLPQLSFRK